MAPSKVPDDAPPYITTNHPPRSRTTATSSTVGKTATSSSSRRHKSTKSYDAELLEVLQEFRKAKARRPSLPQGVLASSLAESGGIGLSGISTSTVSRSLSSGKSTGGERHASSTSSSSHHRSRSRSRTRSTESPSTMLLSITTERLEQERARASSAERQCAELMSKIKTLHEAQLQSQRELDTVRQELNLYKIQLELAQKEILRAQEIVNEVDQQRVSAEQEASRNREKVRRLMEERILAEALEEGRRAGYREGLREGKSIALAQLRAQEALAQSEAEEEEERRRQRRPRRNTMENPSRERKRSESVARPSTSQGGPQATRGGTHRHASPPPPGRYPSRSKTPVAGPSRVAPIRERSDTPPLPSSYADTGHFRSQLPAATITTPVPVLVPSTQTQPPERVPESIEILPASSHSNGHGNMQAYTPRANRSDVHLPPDGYIPTLNPADNSISLPPPHELSMPMVPIAREGDQTNGHETVSSKVKGKTPIRGGGLGGGHSGGAGASTSTVPPGRSLRDRDALAVSNGPTDNHHRSAPQSHQYHPHQPSSTGLGAKHETTTTNAGDVDYFSGYHRDEGRSEGSFFAGMSSGYTGYGMGMYSSTPRNRRNRAASVTSYGASTRISQFDLVAPPSPSEPNHAPSARYGLGHGVGGPGVGAVDGAREGDDPDQSFGWDFMNHNQRKAQRDAQGQPPPQSAFSNSDANNATNAMNHRRQPVIPRTPETPTPAPRTRPRAQTQPQEMAAYWRSKNSDIGSGSGTRAGGETETAAASSRNGSMSGSSRNRTRGGSISTRLHTLTSSDRDGGPIERPKTVEPHLQRSLSPRPVLHPNSVNVPANRNVESEKNKGAHPGTYLEVAAPDSANFPNGNKRTHHRTFTSGTTPEIGVEPPSRSPTSVSDGTVLDPVLLSPSGAPGPSNSRPSHDTQQRQQPTYVGYYMAPSLPRFDYTSTGIDVRRSPSKDSNNSNVYDRDSDRPPGYVVPLSPIPSLSQFRFDSALDAETGPTAPIYGRPNFESFSAAVGTIASPGANPATNRPKDEELFGNNKGFFSPAPLNRPISLFSDT
ncbi:hypothetical protein CC1G_04898 [Coprinopsis cinerea okayama7|uniref:Uncharacterized protein n=1 Tax=Coprinopsis cinerea (strain Okayama-7 / 130 / ATCC MYA-4618 / FGSC 9003) TaxID=240176 RepID=A8PFF7_COPC7|nr:hypothetical protein CC1G_04898 [Coprinopsis cinerea okayama7\|eukprot:XP_001841054.2 hypothetical protein CC1G_04898 [Coprinopsis cinerea okayama7\